MGGDIPLAANIPNIVYLAPTCKEEYLSMLEWGLNQKDSPVVIRVPGVETVSKAGNLLSEYSLPAKYEIVEHGIHATLINPRYASAVDREVLGALPGYGHRAVVTLED